MLCCSMGRGQGTYGDLRIRLQREGRELRLLVVCGGDGDAWLRAHAQGELLAAGRNTGDGLEASLEVRYGP